MTSRQTALSVQEPCADDPSATITMEWGIFEEIAQNARNPMDVALMA